MRKLIGLAPFLLISVAFFGVYPAASRKAAPALEADSKPIQKAVPGPTEDPPGTINGAVTPELIPDDVAYSLFFKFLAGRQDHDQKNSLKSFLKQKPQLADIDAEALMRLADEYHDAYTAIENEERALAARSRTRSSVVDAKFALLKQRRQSLVREKISGLPNLIGTDGAEKVRQHVMEYVKRKIKIAPPPPMPPMD